MIKTQHDLELSILHYTLYNKYSFTNFLIIRLNTFVM